MAESNLLQLSEPSLRRHMLRPGPGSPFIPPPPPAATGITVSARVTR